MAKYRALVGIDYPPDVRVEAGEIAENVPGKSIKWLVEQEIIELVGKADKTPVADDAPASDEVTE